MKKSRWRAALLLCAALMLAAALPAFAEGANPAEAALPAAKPAEEQPEKEYQLLVSVSGPVHLTVTHPGETPDADPVVDVDPDDYHAPDTPYILPERTDYRIELKGTGEGTLTYTVALRDPAGEEEDRELHRLENIAVTDKTVITAAPGGRDQLTLLADADGDGKPDAAYGAGKNSVNFTVTSQTVLLAGILLLVLIAIPLLFSGKRKITVLQKPILHRKG